MGRRLFTLASTVSLVLCVLVLVAAALPWEQLYIGHNPQYQIYSGGDGYISISQVGYGGRRRLVSWWQLILSTAALPAIRWRAFCGKNWPWMIALRRIRQRCQDQQAGYCRVCGYDLRATPDRCPECGTPVVKGASTAKGGSP
jgi:hypothetical protein